MKRLLLLPGMLVLAAACNNPGDKLNDTGSRPADSVTVLQPPAVDTSLSGCYAFEAGRDTVMLQLEKKAENVSGSLSYNYFEKDRNDGTLQGTLSGDRITGFYLFKSEGVMSVRQEIWKVSNGQLVPGSGEMIQRNDSMLFRDPAAVKFDETRALKKRACII
ncbi:MAG: hypothetical protein EOO05_03975 [Chitinophagaceae bacterium]|nr:MAG: hypothetical protein EOO05_03975 [Chitinophagaceae bacterium]